jgi:hypothetical protein
MAGMPSCFGSEHKGRHGDGSYSNYQNSTFWDTLKKPEEDKNGSTSATEASKP